MQRDRAQSEQRLIEAVGLLIAEEGYEQIGINRVAARAGVNKILIYRYFGGLQGLLQAYIRQNQFTAPASALDFEKLRTASVEEIFDSCSEYIISQYRRVRQDVGAQELLKAELLNKDLPSDLFQDRERRLKEVIDQLGQLLQTPYAPAYATFMHSAMITLTLLKRQNKTPLGLDLNEEAAWEQIEVIIRHLFKSSSSYMRKHLASNRFVSDTLLKTDAQTSDGDLPKA